PGVPRRHLDVGPHRRRPVQLLRGEQRSLGQLDRGQVRDHQGREDKQPPTGRAVNPSGPDRAVYGRTAATVTPPSTATICVRLAALRQNGLVWVRMTKTTRAWVASDSTNRPARNSARLACNASSRIANVRKSNSEDSGPEVSMKRRIS